MFKGEVLKRIREEKRITQDSLADSIGKSKWTIIRMEKGTLIPTVNEIGLLATRLGVSVSDLTDFENMPPSSQVISDAETLVPILERDWIAAHEKEFFDEKLYSGVSVSVPLSMEKLFSASTAAQKPYAVFVENDGLERSNYYENDLVILDANKPALQGVVALIKHYGVLALRLIYNLPDGSILLQNDDGEVVVSVDEKTTDGVYKCFGAAIGCIRAKPKAQPLVRKK